MPTTLLQARSPQRPGSDDRPADRRDPVSRRGLAESHGHYQGRRGLHPLWTIPASFLFGGLLVGGNALQRAVQVPTALILALNGLVVVFVVASDRYRRTLRERASQAETAARLAAEGEATPVEGTPAGPAPPEDEP